MTSRPIPKAGADPDYGRSLRRLLTGVAVAVMIALFAIWRIDNARVEIAAHGGRRPLHPEL